MIIGIAKILIIFPFMLYLIFLITSKNRKLAHVYCGPFVLLSIGVIINYLFDLIFVPIVLGAYLIVVLFLAKEKTKNKRTAKRFWMYCSFFCSKVGFRLYILLVVIGTVLEMLK